MTRETKTIIIAIVILIICILLIVLNPKPSNAGVTATKIGEVTCIKRLLQGNDEIHVNRIDDPENPFVSIYITQVKSGKLLAAADPSNSSIACRLTGKIPVDKNGKRIINKKHNPDIVHFRKSIGTKVMKIARWYDSQKDVLVYLVYTTKMIGGSLKHSESVVPLGNPLAP